MTINSALDRDKPPKDWMKIGFYAIAILFNLCLIAQLLTVGIAYFNDPSWWQIHVLLVRGTIFNLICRFGDFTFLQENSLFGC